MDAQAPAAREAALEKEWWLRLLAVFQSPVTTFAALRDEADDQAGARQEPILALVLLAGIAAILATGSTSGTLFDGGAGAGLLVPASLDGLEVAVFVFLAGGIYGIATYWLGGAMVYLGVRGAGGTGSYRRIRHVLAYAVAPLVLSLLVLWPLRLAVYGGDNFRTGGADEGGVGSVVFEGLEALFFLWALALLVVGIKTVHGWTTVRALGALALAAFAVLGLALVLILV